MRSLLLWCFCVELSILGLRISDADSPTPPRRLSAALVDKPGQKTATTSSGSAALLRVFNGFKGSQLFASADYNLDKISDLLFYNTTEKGTDVTALCKLGEDAGVGAEWIKCATSSLPIKSQKPISIRPLQLDNGMSYIVLEPHKSDDGRTKSGDRDSSDCQVTSYIPGFRDLARSPYDYAAAWHGECDCDFAPLFIDLNFDGLIDMLVMVNGRRVAYLASGLADGIFLARNWTDLTDSFDLTEYSSRDRFPIDQETVKNSAQYLAIVAGETSSGADGGSVSLQTEESPIMLGILNWFKSWLQEPTRREVTLHSLKEHFLDFQSNALELLYYQENDHQWLPRPLPLTEPSVISGDIPGALEIDMDGDCLADLVLIIESPDFQGRHELEVWLTEARDGLEPSAASPDRIRRLWRSQRLLLPEGLISVGLSDLFNTAGSDLVALAKGSSDGVTKIFTFRMLHEIQTADALCKPFHFSYGGLNGRVEREYMTISPIEGEVFSPNLFIRDIDGDRFDDIVLVMTSQESGGGGGSSGGSGGSGGVVLRVFNSAGGSGGSGGSGGGGGRSQKSTSGGGGWKDEDLSDMKIQFKILYWMRRICSEISAFVMALTSPKKMWEQILQNVTGSSDSNSSMIMTRSFERAYDLPLTGPYEKDSSAFGWLDPSTFVAWNGNPAVDGQLPIAMFAQTGARGELGFFTRVKVYGAQCLPENTAAAVPPHRASVPLSGVVVALAPPGMDGKRLPARRTQSSIDSHYAIQPASLAIGFGDSSNYIDAVTVGVPFSRFELRTCGGGLKETSPLKEPHAFRKVWSAIMPNSELLIELRASRWNSDQWRLTLIVAPGRQVVRVVVAMMIALVVVGLYNLALARKVEERQRLMKGY